jgi:hypothetical protein
LKGWPQSYWQSAAFRGKMAVAMTTSHPCYSLLLRRATFWVTEGTVSAFLVSVVNWYTGHSNAAEVYYKQYLKPEHNTSSHGINLLMVLDSTVVLGFGHPRPFMCLKTGPLLQWEEKLVFLSRLHFCGTLISHTHTIYLTDRNARSSKFNKISGVVSPVGRGLIFTTVSTTTLWEKPGGRYGQAGSICTINKPKTVTEMWKRARLMTIKSIFWSLSPCSMVKSYQRFRGNCCLHLQGNYHKILVQTVRIELRILRTWPYTSRQLPISMITNHLKTRAVVTPTTSYVLILLRTQITSNIIAV